MLAKCDQYFQGITHFTDRGAFFLQTWPTPRWRYDSFCGNPKIADHRGGTTGRVFKTVSEINESFNEGYHPTEVVDKILIYRLGILQTSESKIEIGVAHFWSLAVWHIELIKNLPNRLHCSLHGCQESGGLIPQSRNTWAFYHATVAATAAVAMAMAVVVDIMMDIVMDVVADVVVVGVSTGAGEAGTRPRSS